MPKYTIIVALNMYGSQVTTQNEVCQHYDFQVMKIIIAVKLSSVIKKNPGDCFFVKPTKVFFVFLFATPQLCQKDFKLSQQHVPECI